MILFLCGVACREKVAEPSGTKPTAYDLPPLRYTSRLDTSEAELTVEGIALGKALFNDKNLSSDGTVSCQSCHLASAAFSDPRRVSLGVGGVPGTRNAMSLVNLAYQSHFFWDGRVTSLEQLMVEPMTRSDEMNLKPEQIEQRLQQNKYIEKFSKAFEGKKPTFLLARKALSMYVRSLVSVNSKYDRALLGTYTPTPAEKRGMDLFFQHPDARAGLRGGNCGDCHQTITVAGNTFGFDGFKNNGLSINNLQDLGLQSISGSLADLGKFKVPTLRNIALTSPYMHDGRFTTLEQVLDHYNDPALYANPNVDVIMKSSSNLRNGSSLGLTEQEKADIITFLHMLTDTTHLNP